MATEIKAAERTMAPRRRFTLLDGMVLVAATAVGYAGVHAFASQILHEDLSSWLRDVASDEQFGALAAILMFCAMPVLAAWTLALVPLGLLKPRARFRRLARQPGLVAAISFATATGFLAIIFLLASLILGLAELHNYLEWFFIVPLAVFGAAVSVSWTTLIVGRRWRAEPTWIDRLGWVLGVFWIVFGLASPFVLLLF